MLETGSGKPTFIRYNYERIIYQKRRKIMKHRIMLVVLFCLLISVFGSACADEFMPNPSVDSAGEIAFHMPDYWLANYIEIQEFMKQFPDFQCEHYSKVLPEGNYDQIICSSVNNNRARDVIINFYFTGDHAGMTGLRQAVFTIGTPEPADFQEVLEKFWNPENYPWHTDSDGFYGTLTSMVFYSRNTVERFDLPKFDSEWDKYTTVDLWDSSQSRMGVG